MTRNAEEAAAALENLAADIKQAVIDIREHADSTQWVYARLYYLRYDLSQIVARMGVGVPVMKGRKRNG